MGQASAAITTVKPMSITGTSSKTKEGYSVAQSCFNVFLSIRPKETGQKTDTFNSLSEQKLCSMQIFQEFATYLAELTEDGDPNSSSYYSTSTATQFLSGVFNSARIKFPKNELWLQTEWMSMLRDNLTRQMTRKIISRGESIQDKSAPLGRTLMKEIARALIKTNQRD